MRFLALPPRRKALLLRHPPSPWLASLLRETFLWTSKRSTRTYHPSPVVARALSFPQLVRREQPALWGGFFGGQPRPPDSSPFHPSPESAVVLDLLMALPEELSRLPCATLVQHMSGMYRHLTAPQRDLAIGGLASGTEDSGAGSRGQEETGQARSQAPENAGSSQPISSWQAAGVCPLNPFLVPLELLGQVAR